MTYENWKIEKEKIFYNGNDEEKIKEAEEARAEYSAVADWCNDCGTYTIIEEGKYFAVALIPAPSDDEEKARIKGLCADYIDGVAWRVERYNTQKAIDAKTSDSEEMYLNILQYMEYCREYDNKSGEWWKAEPLTFDEWLKK